MLPFTIQPGWVVIMQLWLSCLRRLTATRRARYGCSTCGGHGAAVRPDLFFMLENFPVGQALKSSSRQRRVRGVDWTFSAVDRRVVARLVRGPRLLRPWARVRAIRSRTSMFSGA